MKKIILAVLVLGVLAAAWFWLMLKPVNAANTAPIAVSIEKGQSVGQIGDELEKNGLVRSALVFKIYARLTGRHTNLQAGRFTLNQSQSVGDILDTLQSGKTGEFTVTIPEGWTVADIDGFLASKGIGKRGDIIDCAFSCDFSDIDFLPAKNFAARADGYGSKLEGYLFPETYFVAPETYTPETFLRRMLATFQARVIEAHAAELKQAGSPLHEVVTMASLVEEETRHAEERPTVAGILWKRADAKTVVGVDATVRYVVGKPTAALTVTDLETDSPYNTRKKAGLPPGPIANPGESAIMAALQPEATEYWYYLHDRDGVIHYAKTNDEHNLNKARYLH